MKSSCSATYFKRMAFPALLLMLLFSIGCSMGRPPIHIYDEDGKEVSFKRRAKYEVVDNFHRWRSEVYEEPNLPLVEAVPPNVVYDPINPEADKNGLVTLPLGGDEVATRTATYHPSIYPFGKRLSEDQQVVALEMGIPTLVRPVYETMAGELVNEWLYMKERVLVQFVRGELVYTGDVTDKELTLHVLGYPSYIVQAQVTDDHFRETFVYRNRGSLPLQIVGFANDELVRGSPKKKVELDLEEVPGGVVEEGDMENTVVE